ncbi:Long-chain-fatty-acid--CoA ligase [Mycolicibacterium vanbaalenii]|uniref:Long-chain-fatty-acid--CoA ligase n=1 Tax=Mycolicibacterium vanbaalenii TaxID=110539 RepID=A0A5S9R683_MYCVN|nr:AMP-binding protein [Mycolicibacterium vanbaalenii]CAA0129915.1 Long-chain-fatty-acid--CoA ligase [Mycolicibacterium vanbaalenii]
MTFAAQIARERRTEIAVRDRTRSLSWAEADDHLRRTTRALQKADLGERKRVAVLAGNSVDTLLAYVACTLAGASAVAVNSHLTASETAYILRDSGAALVFCDTATAHVAAEAAELSSIDAVICWGEGSVPGRVTRWSDWADDLTEPRTDVTPRRTVVYTSGTTGRPKGVELPLTSWVGGEDIAAHLAGLARNRMVDYGRHLIVGPMYHSGPLSGTRLFAAGVPVTVVKKFDVDEILAAIERDRIGSTIMVPTHFQRLLAAPEEHRSATDTSSLRYVLQVGAKCPVAVKQAMIDWLGPIVWESYGASEVGTTCIISAEEWLQRPGSVGRAVAPFAAYIRGDDGLPLPPNTEGPLWFRDTTGHGVNYLSGAGSGSDFTLGEIGRMDEDGYVWITDRLSDMVVSGGVNIYPAEVEQALLRHPDIADIACVGVPHDEMGEQLVALVVPAADRQPSYADLVDFARTLLAGYKLPRLIYLIQSLPHTAVGKVDKRELRRLLAISAAELSPLTKKVGATR